MARAPYFCQVMSLVFRLLVLLVLLSTLTSCAMKVAPSGGPRDTTPAEVESTDPADGTRNVSDRTITVRFSDYVDRGVRNAIVVQPKVRFSSSYAGNEIDVTFEEDLLPNTTYTVTLGTDWRDLRGNSPTRAATVTFSTGPDIDTGSIDGIVTGRDLKNVRVLVYRGADTLSADFTPAQAFADYVMPVGSSGAFTIAGLRDGLYRVVAVQDNNGNDLVDANEDYAMAPSDIEVVQGASPSLALLMGPSIASVREDSVKAAEAARADTAQVDTIDVDSTVADSVQTPVERVVPGRIEGTFLVETDLKGPYLLRFKESSGAVAAVVRVQNGETWVVEDIPPGTYSGDLVIDTNQNDRYDHGLPLPFTFAERHVPLDLSVSVRQRWTSEGVNVVVQ